MNSDIDLDSFTLSYIECALWASTDNADDSGGEPLDANYDIDDIAPETLAEMVNDCSDFRIANHLLLAQSQLSDDRAGHNFWLNRNGHGAGFLDDGLGSIGDMLSEASHTYGSFDLYVGDDGIIRSL
jgi:hypothetical protein